MSSTSIINTNAKFISVMDAPKDNGEYTFSLLSYDGIDSDGNESNVDLVLSVPSVCSTDTEIEVAKKIEEAFNDQLEDYLYSGTPVYSNQSPPATFRVHRSDHVVCLWSQVAFDLTLTDDTSDSILKLGTIPGLCTVDFARAQASAQGFEFEDDEQEELTDDQIAEIILQISAFLISKIKSNVVLCTYLNSFRGKDQKAVPLRPTPGYKRDTLICRYKNKGYVAEETTTIPYPSNYFQWDKTSGEFSYRPDSQLLEMNSPFRKDNEVLITIQAGWKSIPEGLQRGMMSIIGMEQSGSVGFTSLAGGSFKIELEGSQDVMNYIYKSLKIYKSK